ncbi:hypothetical protein GBA63_09155 [Rubrobacter tropicus]|uniref:Uncharacterized protein n=1 Tax=Rubrobacter tropicus TaxID=2653851 RepID=A0A6G8Q8M4_9ACTN|nr:hypothetical protein [Rubrobacter tropicus]QIN82799.1 hypothetical protein GBA63_09155 [Rubrobacter tropicus]
MRKIHNFQQSLKKSKDLEDSPFWFDLYKKRFPGLVSAEPITEDGWAQRAGIDRLLILSDGSIVKVDEKVRQKDYGDFLLEYHSSYERKTPGWISKDLNCDFVSYVVVPAKKCYLLHFQLLRHTWEANHKAWIAQYPRIEAKNDGYTTVSVAVPRKEVWRALKEAMVITWEGDPFAEPSRPNEAIAPDEEIPAATNSRKDQ